MGRPRIVYKKMLIHHSVSNTSLYSHNVQHRFGLNVSAKRKATEKCYHSPILKLVRDHLSGGENSNVRETKESSTTAATTPLTDVKAYRTGSVILLPLASSRVKKMLAGTPTAAAPPNGMLT